MGNDEFAIMELNNKARYAITCPLSRTEYVIARSQSWTEPTQVRIFISILSAEVNLISYSKHDFGSKFFAFVKQVVNWKR